MDLETCLYELVIEIEGSVPFDLAFHPDGKLYGIGGNGEFYEIDTLTGDIQVVHIFDGVHFQALVISKEGVAYTSDRDGTFWSYDIGSGIATNHGNTGFNGAGDMTFYKGELYMTAPEFDYVVRVDIENPANSVIVMTDAGTDGGAMYGIVTHALDCNDVKLYGIVVGNKSIHEIDLEDQTTDTLCFLDERFSGAATRHEFKQSDPVRITDTLITHPECGLLNGSISITTIGGSPPYQYSLNGNPFQDENSFDGLSEGDYLVLVEDTRGCSTQIEVTLIMEEVNLIDSFQVVDATCGDNNGTITVIPLPGEPLEFSTDKINYQVAPFFDEQLPGLYEITAKNDAGCIESQFVEVGSIPLVSIAADITPTSCGLPNGEIFMYALDGSPIRSSLDGAQIDQDNVFQSIPAGPITIYTFDENNCPGEYLFDVPVSLPLVLDSAAIQQPQCGEDNGSLTLHISNGTGIIGYRVDQSAAQTSSTFLHLEAGDHNWSALDEAGCTTEGNVHLTESTSFAIESILTKNADCGKSNGTISFELSIPATNISSTTNGLQNENPTEIDELAAGMYKIVFTDSQGCTVDTSIVIQQNNCELYVANIFSPNGDGVNDNLELSLPSGEFSTIKQFSIFDRWGNELHSISDTETTSQFVLWDGRSANKEVSAGVYTYLLILTDSNGQTSNYKGDITLIR